jgi:hypothetical protein
MSAERYATRRHHLSRLKAQAGQRTRKEEMAILRETARLTALPHPGARVFPKKPVSSGATAMRMRQMRLDLAEAEMALSPAPKKATHSTFLSPEACSSMMVGGSLYDPS